MTQIDEDGTSWPKPTKQDLLMAAALADELEREPVSRCPEFERTEDGAIILPSEFNYGPAVGELMWLAREFAPTIGFDWGKWQGEAIRLVEDPEALAKADLVTIQKLLFLHWRKERFCLGHWASMHSCGHLAAVARRLGELAEEMELMGRQKVVRVFVFRAHHSTVCLKRLILKSISSINCR